MGLQTQTPLRMVQAVLNGRRGVFLAISAVHRLQVEVCEVKAFEPLWRRQDLRVHEFQFVTAVERGDPGKKEELKTQANNFSVNFRREFQTVLQTRGYFKGTVNGDFGTDTIAAIDSLAAGKDANADQNAQNNTNKNQNDPSQTSTFVTAVLKNNGTTEFTLRGGDATTGALSTYYKGVLPAGWSPMKKQGSIILGIGGDNSSGDGGRWYEGVMASGAASMATINAIQANVVAAKYGK